MIGKGSLVGERTTGLNGPATNGLKRPGQGSRAPASCRRGGGRVAVSLVIPAKDEAANIGWVLARLPESVDEIILVDGSSDQETVEAAIAARPDIRVIRESRPGKGVALRTGFAAARGDFIAMIDADGSMDPLEIEDQLERLHDRRSTPETAADTGFRIVKGSRFIPGGGTRDMGLLRRAGNLALLRLVNVLYGASLTDLCYGLFAFRRDALDQLGLNSDGFEIETEIVVRALGSGVRIGEIPSFEAPRRTGTSNLNTWRDGHRVLRTLLRERCRVLAIRTLGPEIEARELSEDAA